MVSKQNNQIEVGGSDTITLKADRRLIGLLTTLLGAFGTACWYFGGIFMSMQTDIRDMNYAVQAMEQSQSQTVTLMEELKDGQDLNNGRLIRLEEWRKMTTEWANKMEDVNPELVVPPIPDDVISDDNPTIIGSGNNGK